MKNRLFILLSLFLSLGSSAQIDSNFLPMDYIKPMVNHLCSSDFYGRGYSEEGMNKAGDYLANSFRNLKLKPFFGGDYKQDFVVAVNRVEKVEVKLDRKKLRPGYDYLFDPTSGDVKNSFHISLTDSPYKAHLVAQDGDINYSLSVDTSSHLLHRQAATIYPERGTILFDSRLNREVMDASNIKIVLDNETEIHNIFNVAATIPGISDSYIVICAHYDHLGMLGKSMFPGASDNATGTAMMMSLANYFSKVRPYYNLIFIAFAAEETGLLGSEFFTKNSPISSFPIKMVFNLDIMGNAEGGVTVVNTKEHEDLLEDLRRINKDKAVGLAEVRQRGNTKNSDHYYFTEQGIPAVFIYSNGGPGHYHDVYDTPENLGYIGVDKVFYLLAYYIMNE